jgi:hypothetical protein
LSVSIPSQLTNDVPEPVARIAGVMANFDRPWSLCGGWAVDAWLGRVTRDHGDIDISVFGEDQRALSDHLRDWQLLAHDADLPEGDGSWWDGRRVLALPAHIHARPDEGGDIPGDGIARPEHGFDLDIQIDARDRGEWILSREPLITVPLESAVAPSPWGVPAAVPEVLLLFKARDLRRRDHRDFQALLPRLTTAQTAWLFDAIGRLPHPWLTHLRG